MSNIEQIFQARFDLLLGSGLASQASISAALKALHHLEALTGIILDESLGAPLATHLAVTFRRLMSGDVLQPAPEALWLELQEYPVQMKMAAALIADMEKYIGIKIPSDEAGFIALHLARISLATGKPIQTSNPATHGQGEP